MKNIECADNKMTLAEALVNERQKNDISIEQISGLTNIKANALDALETGKFQRLPGKFYFVNYIKTYLHAVGADEEEFFKKYGKEINRIAFNQQEEPDVSYTKLRYARFKKKNILLVLLILSLLLITAVAVLYYTGHIDPFKFNWSAANKSHSPLILTPDSGSVNGVANTIDLDQWPVTVEIQFDSNCWAQIYQGRDKIDEKVFQAGETKVYKGYHLQVTVGNPSGLSMRINGKEVNYLKTLARSERMDITPSTIDSILSRQ